MKQPKALIPLFLTEVWERFGFYTVEGLMVLFLTEYLHYRDNLAYSLLGEFSALIYIFPVLGGYIADRLLGYRNAIMLGAVLLFFGYAIVATTNHEFLFIGLAVVILGTGLLKPNISSYLGEFYQPNDPRREAGFTIFYIGINIGGVLAPLTSGFLQQKFGWAVSFSSAAVGLLIAIISFYYGYSLFEKKGLPPSKSAVKPRFIKIFSNKFNLAIGLIIITGLLYALLRFSQTGEILQYIFGAALFIGLLIAARKFSKQSRQRFTLLIALMIVSIFFWGVYFQIFFSGNLFVERNVNRQLFGYTIPTTWFLSIVPFFIIVLGPFFAKLWENLSKRNANIFLGNKFALAMLMVGLSMFILDLSTYFPEANGLINPLWIILSYFALVIGELLLSPIGLSMVTELSPSHWVGLMMGVWFMTLGLGGSLSGYLAQMATIPQGMIKVANMNLIFGHAFLRYALLAIFIGFILLLLNPWLKKLQ